MKTYIHYGSNSYDPSLVEINKNNLCHWLKCKPNGLWASPINSDWGWKDFCESEDFKKSSLKRSFKFNIKDSARVLHIYHREDINPYIISTYDSDYDKTDTELNIKKLYKDYDAIELHMSQNYEDLHYSEVFYTWDVDSICIWNPAIIELVKN